MRLITRVNIIMMMIAICALQSVYIFAEDEDETRYLTTLYNNLNGLPTSEANDIVQTNDGYIWIGSYSSLLRYDGKVFETIDEPKGMSSIMSLYQDRDGRMWVGTNNDGVVLYDNSVFTIIDTQGKPQSLSARAITQNTNGDIIVGSSMGIYKVDENFEIEVLDDSRLAGEFILNLYSYGNNRTIGVTKNGALFVLNDFEVEFFLTTADWGYDIPISALSLDNEETFLIGTTADYIVEAVISDGKIVINRKINTESLNYIRAIVRMEDNSIWVASDTGVGRFDSDIENCAVINGLEDYSSLEQIMQDKEGNYWIASSSDGVIKLSENNFTDITVNIEDKSQVNGVQVFDDRIYIGMRNGITIIDKNTYEVIENEFTEIYGNSYTRCITIDGNNNIWFSTYSDYGLIKYNPTTEEVIIFNPDNGLDYSRIRSTLHTTDGNTWVGTGNGIYVIENDVVIKHYGKEDGIDNLEILTLTQDANGKIFAGTDGAGLYVIENGEVVKNYKKVDGFGSEIIMRTETDPNRGGTWVITGNSIEYIDLNGDITFIDKFPYSNNFDMLFYNDVMVIISSNGVYMISNESMLDGEDELKYKFMDRLNGIYSVTVANSFSLIHEGVLYLCGSTGVSSIPMDYDELNFKIPDITIPVITAQGEAIYPDLFGNSFHIGSDVNSMQIDIFVPLYSLQSFEITYILEGYDKEVHRYNFEDLSDPVYSNVPGGNYRFTVELLDRSTSDVLKTYTILITKEYRFFEHPITIAILILIGILSLVAIMFGFFRSREKKLNKEKQRMTVLFDQIVESFSKVIDAKDGYTNGHSKRVAIYTREIAKAMDFSDEDAEVAYGVGLLHDVGKIAIPDAILNKPSGLTNDEYNSMKMHTEVGAEILKGITIIPDIVIGAKYHHERYDGGGYGVGLKGEDIPLIARIICVADSFDAMYSSRVYRKKLQLEDVIKELRRNEGTQFDPYICEIFIDLIEKGVLNDYLIEVKKEDEEIDKQRAEAEKE